MSTTHHRTASKLRTVGSSSRTEDPSDSDRDEDGEGGAGEGEAGVASQEASEAATQKRLSAGYNAVLQAQERLDTRSSSFGEASETVLKAGRGRTPENLPHIFRRSQTPLEFIREQHFITVEIGWDASLEDVEFLGSHRRVPTGQVLAPAGW